jgi:hypothetical protein
MNTPIHRLARLAAALTLVATLATLAPVLTAAAPASLDLSRIELSLTDPGRTGLAAGRYRVEPVKPTATPEQPMQMLLRPWVGPAPAMPPSVELRARGCDAGERDEVWSWGGQKAVVVPRPDGSRELRIPSRQSSRCLLVGVLAAQQNLVTPPPVVDPPPPPGDLTVVEPGSQPTPPRDPGDPGPLPSQVEPGLKDATGGGGGRAATRPPSGRRD